MHKGYLSKEVCKSAAYDFNGPNSVMCNEHNAVSKIAILPTKAKPCICQLVNALLHTAAHINYHTAVCI